MTVEVQVLSAALLKHLTVWLSVFLLGICQLVLMDIDATHINVGGIFYAKRQSILKKKNF